MIRQQAQCIEITTDEIIKSLEPLNHTFFYINDLNEYANKLVKSGRCKVLRKNDTSALLAYVLFYDNEPEIFISMVWTDPQYQGQGYAKQLIKELINDTNKDILLEVNPKNPAKLLYEGLKFTKEKEKGENIIMRYSKRLSIMQPYIFPYLGYFHLIEASDKIVFYDDVNYIKGGWINRNKILLNDKDFLFTVHLKNASSNKLINEIVPINNDQLKNKLFKQIKSSYNKAPFYNDVSLLIYSILKKDFNSVADLAIDSIVSIYSYLGKEIKYTRSSICSPLTKGIDKADRVIQITKDLGYKKYINSYGGRELYSKSYFKEKGIELSFVQPENIVYKQFSDMYIPGLSIIDILMFNEKRKVKETIFTAYNVVQD